ncbi:MAG: hypothetical protein Q4F96_02835 [Bacillota bacterium]|nr:hypothetical protein [Bacillota bacterium]
MKWRSGTGNRILALTATAVLALTVSTVPAFAADAGMAKEETVYVVTDPSGVPEDITVSDHLKNSMRADTINDETDLTEIENVKGDETFSKGKENQIIWKAGGKDIYYDGKSAGKLPVIMQITYTLDGEQVSGEELEGKSGQVKMTFDFENTATVNVNGRNTVVPFLALTGFIIRDNCLTDVTIDNGKILDDGNKQIVVGMAAPGLREALRLDRLDVDVDLSDSFTIRGTADDFSVQDMMTVVTNSIFEDLDGEDLPDLDYDDQIKQLDKGAKALVSGSDLLYRGIHTMNGSMPKLESGVDQLKSGANRLSDGTGDAREGAEKLNGGLSTLGEQLKESMGNVVTATSQLETGTDNVLAGLGTIKAGLDGTETNPGAISSLTNAADLIKKYVPNDVSGNSVETMEVKSASDADEAAALAEYLKEVDAAVSKHSDALKAAGYGDLVDKTGTMKSYAQKLAGDTSDDSSAGKKAESQMAAQAGGQDEELKNALKLVNGVKAGLAESSKALGVYEPEKGQQQDTIIGGLTVVDVGLGQLNNTVSQAIAPEGALSTGLDQLTKGSRSLVGGEKQLAAGAKGLADAMNSLEDNTYRLSDGVSRLNDGSRQLRDGMGGLYQEGIRKIVDLYNGDLKGSIDDLRDTIDAGQEYKSFTRLPDGMDGKVKFIYKTSIY